MKIMLKKFNFKYLIIDSNDLLGSKIRKNLLTKDTFCIVRNFSDYNSDLTNSKKLLNLFNEYKFSNAINCVAIANINKCEKNKIKFKNIE